MVAELFLALLLALSALTSPARADGEVRFEQKLDATIPETTLIDEYGARVKLTDLLGGRPAILTFAYYRCPHLCNLVLDSLVQSLKQVHTKLGEGYRILTVSIDPKDTPGLARAKMRSALARLSLTPQRFPQGVPWHFLTGAPAQLLELTNAAGFHYTYDAPSGE